MMIFFLFFFFSSRRRHTRLVRDWSSDVCSSDLIAGSADYIIPGSCLLSIYAGPTALQQIRREGLKADQFKVLVGASGGPKWFVLYGLDRYLFGEFFPRREQQLITLGSSAGAWRLCCLAISDPVSAIERLARLYSRQKYSDQPTAAEISEKARAMLSEVLGSDGARQIVENQYFRTHIITSRVRGLGASRFAALQVLALLASAA